MKLDLSTGNYLRGDEIPAQGLTVKLLDEGTFVKRDYEDGSSKQSLEFNIEILSPKNMVGQEKIYTMNKTSQQNIANAWGDDTIEWVGEEKEISIHANKANVRGTQRDVMYAKPIVSDPADED